VSLSVGARLRHYAVTAKIGEGSCRRGAEGRIPGLLTGVSNPSYCHMSRNDSLSLTAAVVAHLAIGVVHTIAHDALVVELTRFQDLFVQIVYLGLPLLAAVLVWTRFSRSAALLLTFSMAASLVFGAWYHFLFVSPDHVAHLPEGDQQFLFQATAVLMGLIDAGGAWQGLRLARRTS
jgi:hypothetical protein